MKEVVVPTYTIDIFMAGDWAKAEEICSAFADEIGLCVTITETVYVYTGSTEHGVKIGLINYPRFPTEPHELWLKAFALADKLREGLEQESYSIVGPDRTVWRSWRRMDNPTA